MSESAALIYERAKAKAMRDHKKMVGRFMRGEIAIATPCGLDRERQYIIDAFQKALDGDVGGSGK